MAVSPRILVADAARHTRATISDVLRSAGHRDLMQAGSEADLRNLVDQHRPRIVVMAADFPGVSGLDFAKQIRGGYNFVPRETSIILTTSAPTKSLLEAARTVGVDEVVAVPFTTQALTARIRSVIDRPRPFVDCSTYVGPCRRRVMLQHYKGPLRRAQDPTEAPDVNALWSAEGNRAAVRLCVQKMSEYRSRLEAEQQDKLREVYLSVMKLETRVEQDADAVLGDAARSFGRYFSTLSAGQWPDLDILNTHIEALHSLAVVKPVDDAQRLALVANLRMRVDAALPDPQG
ncbi:MAG: response regulator [Hyphomonadaceae bacterium]